MALADILARIDRDARDEAEAILAEAERRAEAVVAQAKADGVANAIAIRENGQRDAEAAMQTILGAARLRARDADVAARRELVERILSDVVTAIASLPADRYTAFIAHGVAEAARGGERVFVAAADREKLSGLRAAVEERLRVRGAAIDLDFEDETAAQIEHGVVLEAPRVRIEVSPFSALQGRRDEMTMRVSELLFGGGA